jgi:hypothetical protein
LLLVAIDHDETLQVICEPSGRLSRVIVGSLAALHKRTF